ncbi:MAG: ribosome small subunit-dependent GTPase A, partial [Bacteroidota bacterium]
MCPINRSDILSARVVKSTGSWYEIIDSKANMYSARLRGKFRQDTKEVTNPIAVGDEVLFEQNEDGTAQITEILERKNFLPRKATHGRRGHQILIAN